MMNPQKKIELTDKDFMDAYGESSGIGGRFLLLFLGLFVAIFGFIFPGFTVHRVMQIFKQASNKDNSMKTMFSLTKEYGT